MPVSPCNEIPQEVDSGTGSAGTLATYSRCDHKHVLKNLGVATGKIADLAITNAKIANSTIDLTTKATYVPVNKAGDTLVGNLDFNKNQAVQLVLHKGTAFPASPVSGQLFYRTDEDKIYKFDGTQWEELGAAGGAPTTASYVTINDETASLPNSMRHVNIPEDQKHTPKAHTLDSHQTETDGYNQLSEALRISVGGAKKFDLNANSLDLTTRLKHWYGADLVYHLDDSSVAEGGNRNLVYANGYNPPGTNPPSLTYFNVYEAIFNKTGAGNIHGYHISAKYGGTAEAGLFIGDLKNDPSHTSAGRMWGGHIVVERTKPNSADPMPDGQAFYDVGLQIDMNRLIDLDKPRFGIAIRGSIVGAKTGTALDIGGSWSIGLDLQGIDLIDPPSRAINLKEGHRICLRAVNPDDTFIRSWWDSGNNQAVMHLFGNVAQEPLIVGGHGGVRFPRRSSDPPLNDEGWVYYSTVTQSLRVRRGDGWRTVVLQ